MDNNNQNDLSTEEQIFEAAKEVFHKKGFDGARMQEIADKAGINKSMLHYYYRSKDMLFEKVYQLSLMRALPQIVQRLNEDRPIEEKFRIFISDYLKVIQANPHIPSFIIHELNTNPSRIQEFFIKQVSKKIQPFIEQLRVAADEGKIVGGMKAEHIVANTMGLIIFPFIGKPILQIIFGLDEEGFTNFIDERVDFLPDYIVDITLNKE